MTLFDARILENGQTVNKDIEAADMTDLYAKAKQQGLTVISAIEKKPGKKKMHLSLKVNIKFLDRIKTHEKILIAKNLSAMLTAGLSLSRALGVINKQTKKKSLKVVLTNITEDLAAGKTFHDALARFPKVFSSLFISMVRAGEESGSLTASLNTLALQMERNYELTKKIRGAMMYPGIILIAMTGIAFFMLTNVIPAITSTFKELNVELPLSTRIIIFVSDFVSAYWYVVILGVVAAIVGVMYAARKPKGKRAIDWLLLHVPVVGPLVKQTNAARTSRTLSSLLDAGVDIVGSMNITRDVVQNTYYKEVLSKAGEIVAKGDQLSVLFEQHENLYPAFVAEMMAVGEETGQLANMLHGVADYYENEVEQKTKDMSSIIEPFLMLAIGGAVGFFALSMIGPIYSIGDAIQ